MPKIRNILIFVAIAVALVLIYILFIQPALSNQNQSGLVSSTGTSTTGTTTNNTTTATGANPITGDFLTLLLNINTIKLDDKIFADKAFASLHDSSITLIPDSTQGRANPFAQFGSDSVATPQTGATTVPPITTPTIPPATKTPATKTPATKTVTPKITTPISTGTNGPAVNP